LKEFGAPLAALVQCVRAEGDNAQAAGRFCLTVLWQVLPQSGPATACMNHEDASERFATAWGSLLPEQGGTIACTAPCERPQAFLVLTARGCQKPTLQLLQQGCVVCRCHK